MAEIAWTRKYRATNMAEYMGQEVKEKTISRFKDEKNFPQTVLVSGVRGTGKTTVCRLIAKTIHCENRQNGCACGVCDSCVAIDEELIGAEFGAKTLGVTEINVGTDGGKADVEQMVEEMMMQPTYPFKYNIFILDECHMFTAAAQNALLKVLEEPPSYLIVMLATTDPDKLLGTVRDRCQFRLQVKPPTVDEIVERLEYIARMEKVQIGTKALPLIARLCKKNPRDSIMTLENVAKNFDHVVNVENVLKEVGSVSTEVYAEYINGANADDPIGETLIFLNKLDDKGISYKAFLGGLSDFVINCIQLRYGIGTDDVGQDFKKAADALFKSYAMDDVDCLLQILEYANKQVMANESMGRLTVLTTAMRIRKVKLLSIGLQHVEKDSADETKRGSALSAEIHKAEVEAPVARDVIADDAMLTSVFGHNTKEITSGANVAIIDDDTDRSGEMTDEELLSLFGYSE